MYAAVNCAHFHTASVASSNGTKGLHLLELLLNTLLFSLTDERRGEEGRYFQGDIRLTPYDDPYDLYNKIFKRVAPVPFDGEGSGVSEDSINSEAINARLWPRGRVPFTYSKTLRTSYL